MVKHNIKKLMLDLNLIKYQKSKKKVVIMYHGICKSKSLYNNRFFRLKSFESHIKYFKSNFNVIPLYELMDNINIIDDKLNVSITFDDGYKNNYDYAFPILKKYKVPAHFFVTGLNNLDADIKISWPDLIDIASTQINTFSFDEINFGKSFKYDFHNYFRNNPISHTDKYIELVNKIYFECKELFDNENCKEFWELMNDEQISKVSKSGLVSIGSHGFYHNNLNSLTIENAKNEIDLSINYLNNITESNIDSIGYPDGSYNNDIKSYCFSKNLRFQCAVGYKFNEDESCSFLTNRLGLYPPLSPKFVEYLIHN